jgi:SAM-dependent methyltransferase
MRDRSRFVPRNRACGAAIHTVATAYNGAGESYAAYADGGSERLFRFDGMHAYADREVWQQLKAKLQQLRAGGANSVSLLDAGCGPGTWLRRLVTHARQLGFRKIRARGFDIAEVQIYAARRAARTLANLPGVEMKFDVASLLSDLPESDASVDIALCLYSVLSHLPVGALPSVVSELSRVTRGCLVTTVRAIGSTPSIFVDSMENARQVKLDHAHDRCRIELRNGSEFEVPVHLFRAEELRRYLEKDFDVEDISGLDIFHNRFAPDRRWNPASVFADDHVSPRLAQLEKAFARNPDFMDRATHLLVVARPSVLRRTAQIRAEERDCAERSAPVRNRSAGRTPIHVGRVTLQANRRGRSNVRTETGGDSSRH